MMARKMASMSCQFYLTVVFLLVLIAVQCTCNLLDDMEMARYNQDYKRSRVGKYKHSSSFVFFSILK